MEPGRPLAGASSGAVPPKRAVAFFSHERKEGRRQAKPDRPFLLAHTKEMVFGEYVPKAIAFG